MYNSSKNLFTKLTKVFYAVVTFIFKFDGSALCLHMVPVLKLLQILPIKFCINFKIALLTCMFPQKCSNYLKILICAHFASNCYCLQVNNDK